MSRPALRPALSPTERLIGLTIRHHRKRKGIFGRELAERVAVTPSTISLWECGLRVVPFDQRERVAAALDIDPMLLAEPDAIEVSADERALLDRFRQLAPSDRDALLSLVAPTQESRPC